MKNVIIDGVEYAPVKPVKEKTIEISRKIQIEVYPKDLGKMNHNDAIKACSDLGEGWRLPTRLELLSMYELRKSLGGFSPYYYWSSAETNHDTAWGQYFASGIQANYSKLSTNLVRSVRDCK